MQLDSQRKGFDPKTGLQFVGKNLFTKSIPNYFHYFQEQQQIDDYFKLNTDDKVFTVSMSLEQPPATHSQCVIVTFRDEPNKPLETIRILQTASFWTTEDQQFSSPTFEKVIKAAIIDKGYNGI